MRGHKGNFSRIVFFFLKFEFLLLFFHIHQVIENLVLICEKSDFEFLEFTSSSDQDKISEKLKNHIISSDITPDYTKINFKNRMFS